MTRSSGRQAADVSQEAAGEGAAAAPGGTAEAPEEQLVASTLAYVRVSGGDVVQVDRGQDLPSGALPEHVGHLRGRGVLVTAAELAELDKESEG